MACRPSLICSIWADLSAPLAGLLFGFVSFFFAPRCIRLFWCQSWITSPREGWTHLLARWFSVTSWVRAWLISTLCIKPCLFWLGKIFVFFDGLFAWCKTMTSITDSSVEGESWAHGLQVPAPRSSSFGIPREPNGRSHKLPEKPWLLFSFSCTC